MFRGANCSLQTIFVGANFEKTTIFKELTWWSPIFEVGEVLTLSSASSEIHDSAEVLVHLPIGDVSLAIPKVPKIVHPIAKPQVASKPGWCGW